MIYAILARDKNNLIGNGDFLPWKDDDKTKWDLSSFKRLTSGNIVFMGFRTFLGFEKPLPDRINVVETKNGSSLRANTSSLRAKRSNPSNHPINTGLKPSAYNNFIFASSLDEFLSSHKKEFESVWKSKKIFIIGGSKTFQTYKDKIDFLYLTTFYSEYKGDVFLPEDFLDGFELKSTLESHENGKIEFFENISKQK